MMRYRRLQHWAMAIGFALVITNGVVGYLTGLSVDSGWLSYSYAATSPGGDDDQ